MDKLEKLIATIMKEAEQDGEPVTYDEAKEMAENYGISYDELLKAYGSLEVVKYDMRMQKALEILRESNR
jgi:hypothetical protein